MYAFGSTLIMYIIRLCSLHMKLLQCYMLYIMMLPLFYLPTIQYELHATFCNAMLHLINTEALIETRLF